VGNAIEEHTEKNKDGRYEDSRAYWLKKVIIHAAIKERWLGYIYLIKF
jgi:hypothetical protein